MASTIKKTTFEDLHETFATILKNIDAFLLEAKDDQEIGQAVWSGKAKNFKTFLQGIEREAIKKSAEELDMSDSTVRERWKTLSLPLPFYDALEAEEVSYSRFKPLGILNFDINSEADNKCAEKILTRIKEDIPIKKIRGIAEEEMLNAKIWNQNHIVMKRLAEQHGITE